MGQDEGLEDGEAALQVGESLKFQSRHVPELTPSTKHATSTLGEVPVSVVNCTVMFVDASGFTIGEICDSVLTAVMLTVSVITAPPTVYFSVATPLVMVPLLPKIVREIRKNPVVAGTA